MINITMKKYAQFRPRSLYSTVLYSTVCIASSGTCYFQCCGSESELDPEAIRNFLPDPNPNLNPNKNSGSDTDSDPTLKFDRRA
jgi:hypothetical protein